MWLRMLIVGARGVGCPSIPLLGGARLNTWRGQRPNDWMCWAGRRRLRRACPVGKQHFPQGVLVVCRLGMSGGMSCEEVAVVCSTALGRRIGVASVGGVTSGVVDRGRLVVQGGKWPSKPHSRKSV